MTNLEKSYETIIKERGLRELPYQRDFLTNPIYNNTTKPLVLAAGTSSGKTFMAIMRLLMFYLNPKNKNKRTLLIPASKTILRDNFESELKWFNPSFTYCIVSNKIELESAIKDKCQVIVVLPQTINFNMDKLPIFHNFILDEAHQWYLRNTIQSLLKQIKPTNQLLLTGSPARFIAKGNEFEFKFVSVMDLYELKQVSNVKLEVVSSCYDFKQSDYKNKFGNLKDSVEVTDSESEKALMMVCKQMITKLKNPIKGLPNTNRLTRNVFSVFGHLGKTIIFCHSLKQADAFYNTLTKFKGLKDKVLVSHSENDDDSTFFKEFKDNDDIKVLIAVDRGRLGFNISELCNVVDFSMTQSLEMLQQMFGRLLRLPKTKTQKIYYKVTTKNTAGYFVDLMTALMCLMTSEYYSKYNGKNMDNIRIPRFVRNTNKTNSSTQSKSKNKKTTPHISLEELGIPLDLNLFNNSVFHKHSDEFSTISWTSIKDVYNEFFSRGRGKGWLSYEDAKKHIHTLGLKKQSDWNEFVKLRQLPENIPYSPVGIYKRRDEWKTWADWLGSGITSSYEIGEKHLSYDNAKKYIKKFKFKSSREYDKYVRDNNIDFLPISHGKYSRQGVWKGWGDYLGHGGLSNQERGKNFRSFESAREFARSLGLKNREEWNEFINTSKMPNDIPRWPSDLKIYPKWNGWGDWLGNGRVKGWQKIKGHKK